MLLLGHHTNPSFGVFIIFFDASSEVHLRSSLQSLHDVIKVTPFNHNVHHRGLWTEAAYGSLKPPPTRRLRRTFLHLSYSMTPSRLLDTTTLATRRLARPYPGRTFTGWTAPALAGAFAEMCHLETFRSWHLYSATISAEAPSFTAGDTGRHITSSSGSDRGSPSLEPPGQS